MKMAHSLSARTSSGLLNPAWNADVVSKSMCPIIPGEHAGSDSVIFSVQLLDPLGRPDDQFAHRRLLQTAQNVTAISTSVNRTSGKF